MVSKKKQDVKLEVKFESREIILLLPQAVISRRRLAAIPRFSIEAPTSISPDEKWIKSWAVNQFKLKMIFAP